MRLFGTGGFPYYLLIMSVATEATSLGRQARNDDNLPVARQYYAKAAKAYREANDLLAYAHTIRHIADIYQPERNPGETKPLYEEALELYRSDLDTKLLELANTVRPYTLLIEEEGDPATARKLWEEAEISTVRFGWKQAFLNVTHISRG